MPFGFGFYWDPTYILVIIGAVLSMMASSKVQTTFNRYSRVRSMTGMTGREAAERLLRSQGITDVRVEPVAGNLTDHYDPRNKVLRLSQSTYGSSSVAAIGVAAHECGHALQDYAGYVPLKIRGALVPAVNFGSMICWPLILFGLFIRGGSALINLGILVFCLAVLFQLVTLPVELNASKRAVVLLDQTGILAGQEVEDTKKVLGAAALTYVAALAASILQLLRILILVGGRRRDD